MLTTCQFAIVILVVGAILLWLVNRDIKNTEKRDQ